MHKYYKIGFALPNLENPGGPVVNVKKLRDHLCSMGHEVHLFPFGKTQIQDEKFIHTIGEDSYKKQFNIFKEKYQKENQYKPFDIFIANNLRTHRVAIELQVLNLLLVFRQGRFIHNLNPLKLFFKRFSVQKRYNNTHIAGVSKCLITNIIEKYKLKPKSYHTLYNPFGNEKLQTKANETIDNPIVNDQYIITVSRLTKGKNVDHIIKAFAQLKQNIKLLIVGDGPELENLKALVKELNLEKSVVFLGWVSNPYPYIKKAKLFVLASSFEGLPTVLLEALELNVPVVSSDCKCGPSEILEGQFSHYLFDIADISTMAQKIDQGLKSYPPIEQLDKEKFRIENITQEYVKIIEYLKENKI